MALLRLGFVLGQQGSLPLMLLPERLSASGFVFTYPDARAALLDLCRPG